MKIITILLIPFFVFATELKIATYNVENLFDFTYDGTEYEEYIPNHHNWTKAIFKKKLEHTVKVICELNADVIGLEEIENEHTLKLLQKALKREGCGYRYSAITHNKGAINVALLSKVAIDRVRYIKVSYSSKDRDILEATLGVSPKLKIFVNHWKSKAHPESQRVKYAKALLKRLKELPNGSEYIILGDFNSDYNECSVIEPRLNDTNGICGIDTLLKTYINHKMNRLNEKIKYNGIYHYNLWSEIDAHKRWSHDYYGKKGSLDSIIIPKTLNDTKGWFYERGTFNVFKKRYLFKGRRVNRWEYKHGKHTGHGYSDHLPIYATFSNSIQKEYKHESWYIRLWHWIFGNKEEIKPTKTVVVNQSLKRVNFNQFLKIKKLKEPVILKNACVIFKRGDIAVIKDSPKSKTINLYKCAEEVEEGECYDLKVFKKKRYYKFNEITNIEIDKKIGNININKYIPKFDYLLMDESLENYGEIVRDIRGKYKNRHITVDGVKFKLYAKKKKRGIYKKNSKLFIKKAQIGYYKGEKELVIYSTDDVIKEN